MHRKSGGIRSVHLCDSIESSKVYLENSKTQMPIAPLNSRFRRASVRGSSCRYSPKVPNVLGLLAGEKLATSVDILQSRQGMIQKQI